MSEPPPPAGQPRGGTPSPRWPSLKKQLAASHVVRGSALEHLIRDNQDFHLLRPEEATDELDVPLWLRVYWRKHHPAEQYSRVDPYGEYPDTLGPLHAWMMAHRDLPWGSPSAPGRRGAPPPSTGDAAGQNGGAR